MLDFRAQSGAKEGPNQALRAIFPVWKRILCTWNWPIRLFGFGGRSGLEPNGRRFGQVFGSRIPAVQNLSSPVFSPQNSYPRGTSESAHDNRGISKPFKGR